MYDPRSPDSDFEWVEIYNNTGSMIDFASTPYVFDDTDNADFLGPNLTSGSIPDGGVAVLFNSDSLSIADMQTMWDPGGSAGANFIPVEMGDFTALGNSGNTVAVWDSFASYTSEPTTGSGRTTENALAVVSYEEDPSWPLNNGEASIQLTGSLQNDGSNWALSDEFNSVTPQELVGNLHDGGDFASPGSFGDVATSADFDGDGDVDGSDFLAWQAGFGIESGATAAQGDADGDGDVDADDFGIWSASYGTTNGAGSLAGSSVPEPSSLVLIGLASLSLAFFARRK